MAEVKRSHDMIDSPASIYSGDSKKHIKPGRKPIDEEPKSKRTAQNRAAQRAYRERKEKKMKDLEDKVKDLEDENLKIHTESDVLKAQVNMLKNELLKYRGGDIELPTVVGKLSHPNPSSNSSGTNSGVTSSDAESNSSAVDSSPDTELSEGGLQAEFPWGKTNNYFDNNLQMIANDKLPDLVSGSNSSDSTSTLNDNILMEDLSSLFDEKFDPFCNQLSEACGTRDAPVPKSKKDIVSPFSLLNYNQILGDGPYNFSLSPKYDESDPLSFLNDTNFDVNLAFDEDPKKSAIDDLVTEESVYDPLKDQINTNFNFNDFVKSSAPSEGSQELDVPSNEDEVVPGPEKSYKCSEIWDRITSHPRYSEIDIDGLCSELKTKAKCSEKGPVVSATDVSLLLEQSATRR